MENGDWKMRLRARYEALKQQGKSFFPHTIFKDTVAVLAVFGVLCALAVLIGAALEEVADPADTTYNPRPEWYFLFLFQALKFFPGAWEPVAAIIFPTLVLLLLLLLPFIDRGPARHPLDRPVWTGLGLVAIAGFGALTVMGFRSPLLNPITHHDPVVAEGKALYQELRCNYCHMIQGRGGTVAPDLTTVGARRDREWLVTHFNDPQQATPGSLMPRLRLLSEEAHVLTAYMQSLGGAGPFSPEAPALFADQCATCHRLDGAGGDAGPDLTTVHTYRDAPYLSGYIANPPSLNPGAAMPGFEGALTPAQIEDLVRYLSSSQRGK
ncbi:MAG: c-type cytochrome [Deltaproteobacteria bacterium]|nr:c-type cytochrome [Deltaproteobacteria bacterium]